jgi:hypothetical protein
MNLADAVTGDLPQLRHHAESLMGDTCGIRGPGTEPVFDPATGTYTSTDGDVVYEGKCRLRPPSTVATVVVVGEQPVSLRSFDLTLPWETTGVAVGQQVTMLASGDPHLVGRIFRVVDVLGGTQTVQRRCRVEDTLDRAPWAEGS